MPRPTPGDRHVDGILSNVGMAFFQDPENYVAMKAFPKVTVGKQSDKFRTYSLGDLLRMEAQKVSPGQESPEDSAGFADTSFFCEKYALKDYLTPEDRANDDGPIDPEFVVTQQLVQAHLTKMERTWAANFFATGKWTDDWQGKSSSPSTNEFLQFDASTADPVDTILKARRNMFDRTGFYPNIAVIGAPVIDHLQVNDAIRDRVKYGGSTAAPAQVTPAALAALFKVDEVLEARAVYNSAAEGQTATITSIFGKSVLLVYRPKVASPRIPSAGYTFVWNTPTDAPPGTEVVVRKYLREEKGGRTDYDTAIYWDQKVTAADLGQYLYDVIS